MEDDKNEPKSTKNNELLFKHSKGNPHGFRKLKSDFDETHH